MVLFPETAANRQPRSNRVDVDRVNVVNVKEVNGGSTATRRYGKLCNLCKNNMTKIYTDVTNVNVAKTIVRCGYHRQDKCVKQSGVSKKYIF